MYYVNARIIRSEVFGYKWGVISTRIINDEDFDILVFLRGGTANAFRKIFAVVVCGNDNGELRHAFSLLERTLYYYTSLIRMKRCTLISARKE